VEASSAGEAAAAAVTPMGASALTKNATAMPAAKNLRTTCGQPSSHSLRTIATATRAPTLDVTEALISLMLWARGAKPAAR